MSLPPPRHVLHFLGYEQDRGGIVATLKALHATGAFRCTLGMNRAFSPAPDSLPHRAFPSMEGETISWKELWRARKAAASVKRWLEESPTRLFHGHSRSGLLVALWLSFARRDLSDRVRCTVHALGRKRWFYRLAKKRLGSRLRWTSPSMAEYFGAPAVTWDECTTPALRPLKSGQRRDVSGSSLHVGMAGTLVEIKEWELALRAWSLLPKEERSRIRFSHIGTTDGTAGSSVFAQRLKSRIRQHGAEAAFTFLGQQESPEPLMASCDLWLVPGSREGFGLTAIEALRAGVPVICAEGAGVASLFRSGRNGWLFKNRDAGDLARVFSERIQKRDAGAMAIDEGAWRPFAAEEVARRWSAFYDDPDVPSLDRVTVGEARSRATPSGARG